MEYPGGEGRPHRVRTERATRPGAATAVALRAPRSVIHEGVRHFVVDVLPRDVVTFRTVCGCDVVEDERSGADVSPCSWCLRVERTWILVKADLGA